MGTTLYLLSQFGKSKYIEKNKRKIKKKHDYMNWKREVSKEENRRFKRIKEERGKWMMMTKEIEKRCIAKERNENLILSLREEWEMNIYEMNKEVE